MPVACFVASGGGEKPTGAVGAVLRAPEDATHDYLIRFADGREAALRRVEVSILKQSHGEDFQQGIGGGSDTTELSGLRPFVIYQCVVGSRAFGLDDEDSDTDRRGIYLPPSDLEWSLFGAPEQLENAGTQECYWELRKFLIMALKANPNILECLHTPLVEHADPLAEELLAMRDIFLSQVVYKTFNGYVLSQFKKLESDLRAHGEVKWKHVMHLLRLLRSGITVLETGRLPVQVGDGERGELLAIKRGELPWDEVDRRRMAAHVRFEEAFTTTRLPERPDYARANAFLLRARRARVV